MSHAFDHGLAKPLRTLVREGVVAALAPLLVENGGYLLAVEEFPTQIRSGRDEGGLALAEMLLNGRAPAILVSVGDKQYEVTGGNNRRYVGRLDVHLIILSNHGRSMIDRLRADVVATADTAADPGIEIILEHAEQLLLGNSLAIGSKASELKPVREEELGTDDAQTLFVQTYTITVSRDVLDSRTTLASIRDVVSVLHGKPAVGAGQPDHQTEIKSIPL